MARSGLSSTIRAAYNAPETGECFVLLVEVDHPTLTQPIRVNNSGQDLVSNGNLYLAMPFTLILPQDDESSDPQPTLTIDNIDRSIIASVLQLGSVAATTVFTVVLASNPDQIEVSIPAFKLRNITYDALTIQGILTLEDMLTEPLGSLFTPGMFPGLF